MRSLLFTIVALLGLWPAAAAAQEGRKQAVEAESQRSEIAPLQAREVIERLKTMRAQLLLEQEYNRLLEARLERQELEEKLNGAQAKDDKSDKPRVRAPVMPPPPRLEAATEQLAVKAVTVAPFKEAIVTYKGRVYTVRPGDRLGTIQIRDINENGVVTAGAGAQKAAVMLGE